ncbi:MAG: type II toxin-antitoxin system death-on-curing family toxin [Oscillospiraceae bacterium]|nr:type II toxin-antitoxin system death-on-curing family toxin [Oscillospiraceae bacterium]
MIKLTKSQVISIHSQLIEATGGSDGIRDDGLLDSSLNSPFQTFGGEDVYPSLMHKASRLCYSIISNHPFIDGNKRIGIHTMSVFLALNRVELNYTQQELIDLGIGIASGNISPEQLFQWLNNHS